MSKPVKATLLVIAGLVAVCVLGWVVPKRTVRSDPQLRVPHAATFSQFTVSPAGCAR